MIRYFRNGPARKLAFPINNPTDAAITVDSASGFPTQFPYTIIIDPDGPLEEVCDVTAAVGNQLTVVRGADGTTASAHAVGVTVYHGVSARDQREANAHVNATTNIHGATGGLVDTDSAQTIVGPKQFTGGLQTTGGDVIDTQSTQSVTGPKTFTSLKTTAGGDVLTVAGTQAVTGPKQFQGNNTHAGTETYNGDEVHNGTEVHNGLATFAGAASFGGANITGPFVSYNPARHNGPGGVNLSTGTNGSLTGRYKLIGGKLCFFEIVFVFGTLSDIGTDDYAFTLPFDPLGFRWTGPAFLFDANRGASFAKQWRHIGGQEIVVFAEDGSRATGAGGGHPLVWADNDEIVMQGFFERS